MTASSPTRSPRPSRRVSRRASHRVSHRASHRRDERGVAFPSPVVMLSIIAVAMAGFAYVATSDDEPTEKRITTTSAPASQAPAPEPVPTAAPAPVEKTTKPKKPQVKRGEVYVEVYNNSGISGLAAGTAAKATQVGWQVVGEDNWYGAIPASTVYYPARLAAAGKLLALDLGIARTALAVEPMRMDRLTIVLTADAA
jgi:hypothetical protein